MHRFNQYKEVQWDKNPKKVQFREAALFALKGYNQNIGVPPVNPFLPCRCIDLT